MRRVLAVAGFGLGMVLAGAAAAADTARDAAVKEACSVDFQKYCPNADDERAYRHCARMHFFKLSHPCRHILLHYRSESPSDADSKPAY